MRSTEGAPRTGLIVLSEGNRRNVPFVTSASLTTY